MIFFYKLLFGLNKDNNYSRLDVICKLLYLCILFYFRSGLQGVDCSRE